MKFLPSINHSDIYQYNNSLLCLLVYIDRKFLLLYIRELQLEMMEWKKKWHVIITKKLNPSLIFIDESVKSFLSYNLEIDLPISLPHFFFFFFFYFFMQKTVNSPLYFITIQALIITNSATLILIMSVSLF